MSIIFYASCILLSLYVLLLLSYLVGWLMIKTYRSDGHIESGSFTIIIPARNEEHTIIPCLQSIIQQKGFNGFVEIIVINDHSSDQTENIVKNWISTHHHYHVSLINLSELTVPIKLKKAAITHAIDLAKGEHIILTDADCTRNEYWLNAIASYIRTHQKKFIYAPVEFNAKNLFERLQSLEFAGLVGIGGAAIQLRNPNMCSAANLVFKREVFFEVNGYTGNDNLASGDDEFLLHKVFKKYPNDVSFLKCNEAIVYTSPNASIKQLADQRKRWVSKSTSYENRYITAIMVGAYLFNASIVLMLVLQPITGLGLLLIKMAIEGLFLFHILYFTKRTSYIWLLPIAELFHIPYVLFIGLWAQVGTYQWKGRKLY